MYETTKKLCNEKPRHNDMVMNKDENMLTKDDKTRKDGVKILMKCLTDQHQFHAEADIDEETQCIDGIEIGCITRAENGNTMHKIKKRKAEGMDSITIELLRALQD